MSAENQEKKQLNRVMILQVISAAVFAWLFSSLFDGAEAITFGMMLGLAVVHG